MVGVAEIEREAAKAIKAWCKDRAVGVFTSNVIGKSQNSGNPISLAKNRGFKEPELIEKPIKHRTYLARLD